MPSPTAELPLPLREAAENLRRTAGAYLTGKAEAKEVDEVITLWLLEREKR